MKKSILAILTVFAMLFSSVGFVYGAVKIEKNAEDYYETSTSLGFSSGKAKLEDVGDYVVLKLDNVAEGSYGLVFWSGTRTDGTQVKVYLRGEEGDFSEKMTGDVYKNGSTTKTAESVFGKLSLPSGTVYLKFELLAGSCRFEKIELVPVVPFEISSVKANGNIDALISRDEVPRSTSVITVSFTGSINQSSVNDETVSLMNGDDDVSINFVPSDDSFDIIPVSTLDYGTDYKLVINGVQNKLEDTLIKNVEFIIKTSEKEADSGFGEIKDGSIALSGKKVSFEGKLIDGNGIGLKGREVNVYYTPAGSAEKAEAIETLLTEEEGTFSFTYMLGKSPQSGDHSFRIVGEYMTDGEVFSVEYDAEAQKALLTQEFNVSQHNTELSKPQNDTLFSNAEGQFISFNGYPEDEQVFDVTIPETGSYIISMKGGCVAGMKLFVSYLPDGKDAEVSENWIMINEFETVSTGGTDVFAYQKAGAYDFEEGSVKIKIGIISTDMHFMGIKIEYADPEIVDAKSEHDFEELSVSAKMISGSGKPMAEKNYDIYLKNPQGEVSPEPVLSGITDENGMISGNITMKKTDACGTYAFVITSEEVPAKVEVSVVYVSKELVEDIADSIEKADSADKIKDILESNEANLSIDLENDMEGLVPDKVYAHMQGADVSDIDEITTLYRASITLEKINQAPSSDSVKAVLSDEASLKVLGIDTKAAGLLTDESLESLAETIFANTEKIESLEAAPQIIGDAVNEALALQVGKGAVVSAADDVTVEAGSGAGIPLAFTESISDARKVTFTIKADRTLLENASVEGENAKVTVTDDVMTVEFSTVTTFNDADDFGMVYLSTPEDKGTYEVKISADILYSVKVEKDTEKVFADICGVMTEKTVTVTTTEKKSNSNGSQSRPSSSAPSGVSRGDNSTEVPDITVPDNPPAETFEFSDLNLADWAKESVELLLEKGIVSESEDKKFNPNNNVKREEFIKMVVLASGIYNENAKCEFSDVANDSWYYSYVAAAFEKGIITGREGNLFGSGDFITRQEMSAIIYRVYKETLESKISEELFADDAEIADYAKDAVYTLKNLGVINGMGDNLFAPNANVTRAMAAKVLAGLLK